jgi:hypothetical protein
MNELTYHGVHQPNSWDMPYRKLMCAVIRQAILHAQGLEMDENGKPTKLKEGSLKATAIEYLLGDDFENECMYLDLPPDFVDKVRKKITKGTYQIPVFTVERKEIEVAPTHRSFNGVNVIGKFGKSADKLYSLVRSARMAGANNQ